MNVLEALGAIFTAIMAILATCVLGTLSWELVKDIRVRYRVKNRFEKNPLASCYCVDCAHFRKTGECVLGNDNHRLDCWFCADASPKRTVSL